MDRCCVVIYEHDIINKIEDYICSTCSFWENSSIPEMENSLGIMIQEFLKIKDNVTHRDEYSYLVLQDYDNDTRDLINEIIKLKQKIHLSYRKQHQSIHNYFFDIIEISHPREVIVPSEIIYCIHNSKKCYPHWIVNLINHFFQVLTTGEPNTFFFFNRTLDINRLDGNVIIKFENFDDYKCLQKIVSNELPYL